MKSDIGFAYTAQYRKSQPANIFERFCAYLVDVVTVILVSYSLFLCLSKFEFFSSRVSRFISMDNLLILQYCFMFSICGYDYLFIPSLGRKLMGLKILYDRKEYNEYKDNYCPIYKPADLIIPSKFVYYYRMPPEALRGLVRTLLIPLLPISIIVALSNKEGKMIHDLWFNTTTVRESEPLTKIIIESFVVFVVVAALAYLFFRKKGLIL